MTDVIIIGAGAAGLMAAQTLAQAGKTVTVLEARERIGGRIFTFQDKFSVPTEAGAEFMHGNQPLTRRLTSEARISLHHARGITWNVIHGFLHQGNFFPKEWDEFMESLKRLANDMSIAKFLRENFSDLRYEKLRTTIKRFVEGYDAAEMEKVSALALRDEWMAEDEFVQYRAAGGFSKLMNYLAECCKQRSVTLLLSHAVEKIRWSRTNVEATTSSGDSFNALKILITVPISVLKSESIHFVPVLTHLKSALNSMETGGVIKFLLEFRHAFWEYGDRFDFRKMPRLNFLFSDAFIPTWWTQQPSEVPLLTGWLAGPSAFTQPSDEESLFQKAIESLCYLFQCPAEILWKELLHARVINWIHDPFAKGAYSYKTVSEGDARKILNQPVDNTLYFAGEALYEGSAMATVEAALVSGETAAKKIIESIH